MKDILQTIIASKRSEIERAKAGKTYAELERSIDPTRPRRSLKTALATSDTGILAEFKRRSPSKGWIHRDADPVAVSRGYETGGASAISVLTDPDYFGGTLDDLKNVRQTVSLPILRKEFIIDPYQLLEAAAAGADAVLLIAAALDITRCKQLSEKAKELGLEVLLEIHSEREIDYLEAEADLIGVNNRNLGTFITDPENSLRLAEKLPKEKLLVSESGISDPRIVARLRTADYKGFLIGETFMRETDPAAALAEFIEQLKKTEI